MLAKVLIKFVNIIENKFKDTYYVVKSLGVIGFIIVRLDAEELVQSVKIYEEKGVIYEVLHPGNV